MSAGLKTPSTSEPVVFAQRYRVEGVLGRGGMAIAEEVTDLRTGARLALKRMLPDESSPSGEREMSQLFEREFYSLSQLAHPRVVQVFDFAHDEQGRPYYTMELLDGGDLRELAPMPYARLCAVLADVCSALSLLHSRRLVHRDVTPRNIRCTRDGKAKLIDFGTILPFGTHRRTVGTPPFCAPEVLSGQDLDGRSDLFALGATAYYALTRRHAYPARDFSMLPALWQAPLNPPSNLVPDVPPALERLILSLLQLEPAARPENAAEVIERLSALVDFDTSERHVVSQAYLRSPSLLGRESSLQRVRQHLRRALGGQGNVIVVTGDSGVGRSRFMGVCLLEGKLQGMEAIQVDRNHDCGPFAAAAELSRQVLQAMPEAAAKLSARHQAELERLLSAAAPAQPDSAAPLPTTPEAQQDRYTAVQDALLALLRYAASRKPLLLVADDLDQLELSLASTYGLLIPELKHHRISLLLSARRAAVRNADGILQLALGHGKTLKLKPLSRADTHTMLSSMVGHVSGLAALSEHLHQVSGGIPGHVVLLAQHLFDHGHLRYEGGAWTVASDLGKVGLPATLEEALANKLDKLSPLSLHLAQALTFVPQQRVDLHELTLLSGEADQAATMLAVDALLSADIVGTDGTSYWLRHRSLEESLMQRLQESGRQALHAQLYLMFSHRAPEGARPIFHLALAGRLDEAIALLQRQFKNNFADATRQLASDTPAGMRKVLDAMIEHAQRRQATARELFELRRWAALFTIFLEGQPAEHFEPVFAQLRHDTGLDVYASLPESMPESERLTAALTQAQGRFDATPPHARVLSPLEALPVLGRTLVISLTVYGRSLNYDKLASVANLAPYAALSPAIDVIQKNAEASLHMLGGRYALALANWTDVLERLEQPDQAQLDKNHCHYMRLSVMYTMGIIDATLGRARALERASAIAEDPLFAINAERIRVAYAFRTGDIEGALRHRRQVEMLRMRTTTQQMFEGGHLVVEAQCYASADDPFRLKAILPEIARMAEEMERWQPVLHLARGYYHRLRNRAEAAAQEFKVVLAQTQAGHHLAWATAAAGLVHSYCDLGRHDEAIEAGKRHLQVALAQQLEHANSLREALARALCARGEVAQARVLIREAIASWDAAAVSGTLLGATLEVAARIALASGDRAEFDHYASRCATVLGAGKNAGLAARYDALMRESQRRRAVPDSLEGGSNHTQIERPSLLSFNRMRNTDARACHCARVLALQTGASDVLIYLLAADGVPRLGGRFGSSPLPSDLHERVAKTLREASVETSAFVNTVTEVSLAAPGSDSPGAQDGDLAPALIPVMLFHDVDGEPVATGMVVFLTRQPLGFVAPYRLMSNMSMALADAGDTCPIGLSTTLHSLGPTSES